MQELNLTIQQGKTYSTTLRWASEPYVYKPITSVANTAPVRLTVPGHGMPNGWRFAVSAVQGATGLNAKKSPPDAKEYYEATVVDENTVDINNVNGLLLGPYRSGGVIQYLTPVDMIGMSARMQVKDRIGGTSLLTLTSAGGAITINPATYTITIRIPPTVTDGLTWTTGVYDLEMYNGADVFLLCFGTVSVEREVTTHGE
jgi:hypothetical protein